MRKAEIVSAKKPDNVPPPKHMLGDAELFNRTMAHISDNDLLAALDLDHPGLAAVKEASQRSSQAALEAFGVYLAQRRQPVDVINTVQYRAELHAYHQAFPGKSNSLARVYNSAYEWTLPDADRTVSGEHLYAGSKSTWVKFAGGKVDWITIYGNIHGFHYFGSLEPLLWAWLYTGNEKYAKAYAAAFNEWWDQRDRVEPQWCIWYKLGLAIRGKRLAHVLHHMAGTPSFNAQTKIRLLKTILGSCRWLMRDWERSPRWGSNWGLFVATGLINMGVLVPEFREAASWVKKGEEIMRRYAAKVKPDGGTEAIGYHNGILLSLTRPQQLLEANGREGYLHDTALRNSISRAMLLLARMTMPNGLQPAIGDGSYRDLVEALAIGAGLLKDEELKSVVIAIGEQRIAETGAFHAPGFPPFTDAGQFRREFLPEIPLKPWRPQSYLFPNQGLTVLRRGDSCSNMAYLAISHGVYSHSHSDFLGITLFASGDILLGDPGVPNYYGAHTAEMRASKAHSCLIVDGANMKRETPGMEAFETGPQADLWRCCNRGYESFGVVNTRTVVNVKDGPGFFVVIDQIKRTTTDKRQLDVYYHTLQSNIRIESPQRVMVGKNPMLTIASPPNNGELWQGKEWTTTLTNNMVAREFPFVAYRRTSDKDEWFCSVLAMDSLNPRDITVRMSEAGAGSLRVEIAEGPAKHLVVVAGMDGKLPDRAPADKWRPVAGKGLPVQLFVAER